jgi:tetratricopeptide (TPR) repeat protein
MKLYLKEHAALIIIAVLFFALGILRLNDLSLYTDSTRYLIWGNSIAHGKGFVDDTQPEPEYYVVNAPLFSVVLAPILIFFPLSLTIAKIWTLLWGVLALILFYHWILSLQGKTLALATTLFLALNPLTLVLATEVLSEVSFLCIIFAVILLLERTEEDDNPRWVLFVLILILSFTTLLREVGITLVISSIIILFIKKKRFVALMILLGSLGLYSLWIYRNIELVGSPDSSQNTNLVFILQHFVTSPETTLFNELTQRVFINFNKYSTDLGGMLLYFFPLNLIVKPLGLFKIFTTILNFLRHFIVFSFFPLIVIGVIQDIKCSKIAFFRLLFLVLYLCLILAYPVQDVRFLFPILPFAIYYLIIALKKLLDNLKLPLTFSRLLAPSILVITIAPNIICIFEILRTNIAYVNDPINFSGAPTNHSLQARYFSTPWKLMGDWIEQHIPASSVFTSPIKEIVPFTPNHKFLELNRAVPLPTFEILLRNNAVEYLIAPLNYDSIKEYQTIIDESKRFRFELLYSVNYLNLFRIHSRLEEFVCQPNALKPTFNPDNTYDLLRFGRLALKNRRYPDAITAFNILHIRYPYTTDIMYQLLLTYAFTLDSANAVQKLQELYTTPAATSYIAPSRVHIHAMNLLLNAQTTTDSALKAERYYEAARFYWDLGFPQQAYNTVQKAVQTDTTFFVGYLWAWHWGIQLGDSSHIITYLHRLEQIDRNNPIVKSYRSMISLREMLKWTNNSQKRSNLRIALSDEYNKIDLPDEAIDEAQLAIAQDSTNKKAWTNLTYLFEKRKQPLAAERARKKLQALESNQVFGIK